MKLVCRKKLEYAEVLKTQRYVITNYTVSQKMSRFVISISS